MIKCLSYAIALAKQLITERTELKLRDWARTLKVNVQHVVKIHIKSAK